MSLLRSTLGITARAVDGAVAWGEMVAADLAHPRKVFDGNDLDAWDPDYVRRVLPFWKTLMSTYFRADVRGLENIPPEGPALLVGNHSGGTMIADTFAFTTAFYDHFGAERRFHQLAHDVAARLPAVGLSRWGTVAASHDNARAAFDRDAPVLVYPGGDYETFRPSWHSDKIEFGGRKGFIKLALERDVPIIPVVAVGGQETALFVTRGEQAATASGWADKTRIKVLPLVIGPPFGVTLLDLPLRVPLPAKITIEVLEPIDLEERFGRDADHQDIYDAITAEMQEALTELQDERTLPVIG